MPQQPKGRNPRVSKGAEDENPQCRVHDEASRWQVEDINQNVCINGLPLTEHADGNHYCLFHLPTKDKDIDKFEEAFRARLNSVEEKIAAIEELPEDERAEAKRNLSYDFRYVWFPSEVKLSDYRFAVSVSFRYATFSASANFDWTIFSTDPDFSWTKFLGYTEFCCAVFLRGANFIGAVFSEEAYFSLAVFMKYVHFDWSSFCGRAEFDGVTFCGNVYFTQTKFEETSQMFFNPTSFRGVADFGQAVIKGYFYFEAGKEGFYDCGEWLNMEKMLLSIVKRPTKVFENRLNFAHVRTEKPERITFNKVRLCPNWFVNVDSRKFVFTDIAWENHKARRRELKQELISLTRRDYKKPHNYQLLTIAFRNLAANAEEFNRFEQASDFRKSASECERLERLNRQRKLWRAFKSREGKSVFELWKQRKEARFDFVHFLYRWLSYYGENWRQAFLWLWVIWIVFALGFYLLGEFGTEQSREYLGFGKSFAYSLFVMTLQKPDPRPLSTVAYILYGLETIFAPVQAALLALAIRRKFMR